RRKALKRKRKLENRAPRRSAPPQRAPHPEHFVDNSRPPDWACRASFTPLAAEMAADKGQLLDGVPLHPHQVAKLRELVGWSGRDWTMSKARATPTNDIVNRLSRLGVDVTPSSFEALASEFRSAWALSQTWD